MLEIIFPFEHIKDIIIKVNNSYPITNVYIKENDCYYIQFMKFDFNTIFENIIDKFVNDKEYYNISLKFSEIDVINENVVIIRYESDDLFQLYIKLYRQIINSIEDTNLINIFKKNNKLSWNPYIIICSIETPPNEYCINNYGTSRLCIIKDIFDKIAIDNMSLINKIYIKSAIKFKKNEDPR